MMPFSTCVDECCLTIRKLKPIICSVLQARGLLYQKSMSQHGPSLQTEYSHPLHEPDNSTALPDSPHRMMRSASRQPMMDGLQMRLEKTLTTLSNDQWTNTALAIMMQFRPIFPLAQWRKWLGRGQKHSLKYYLWIWAYRQYKNIKHMHMNPIQLTVMNSCECIYVLLQKQRASGDFCTWSCEYFYQYSTASQCHLNNVLY